MEEARFWMWPAKPNIGLSSKVVPSTKSSAYGDSWEEQAFEEDAAGPLGGCIWPPSSYTCTFCRREFRSAQALGGHMNVHRRDRARLKQSPSTFNNHILIPNSSLEIDQLPSIGTLVYNKDSDHEQDILNSPTRVLAPIIHEVGQFEGNDISTPWFSSPISTEQQKGSSLLTPLLWSSFTADRYFNIQDTDKLQVKKFDFLDSKCKGKRGCFGTDLSVSLNVSVCEEHNKQDVSSGEEDDYISFKRRKTDHATVLSFLKHNSVHRNTVSPVSQVLENSSILNEDVDLELRLGARSIYKR